MAVNAATAMTSPQPKKRVLFVCTQNRVRSLTAQQMYRGRPDLEIRSAGVSEYARVPLTQDLFEWADQVFVFSKRQKKAVSHSRIGGTCAGTTGGGSHAAKEDLTVGSVGCVERLFGQLHHCLSHPAAIAAQAVDAFVIEGRRVSSLRPPRGRHKARRISRVYPRPATYRVAQIFVHSGPTTYRDQPDMLSRFSATGKSRSSAKDMSLSFR